MSTVSCVGKRPPEDQLGFSLPYFCAKDFAMNLLCTAWRKTWLYLVTFSKFQLCFSSQWRVLFLEVHNKWHLPCLSSLLASALNSYGQERKLTLQLLLKEAQSCGGDWLMIQIEGAEGFGISLTAVLSRCCCLFLVLMWPEALGVGEYKRELQFSTESRVAVTWHCLIPSYSAARLSFGVFQQNLAARLCPHAAKKKNPKKRSRGRGSLSMLFPLWW